MSRLPLWIAARMAISFMLFAVLALPAAADYTADYPLQANSGVRIKIESPLTSLPRRGYYPIYFTISNDTRTRREWQLTGHSSFAFRGQEYTARIVGEPGRVVRRYVSIPLDQTITLSRQDERYGNLTIRLNGYAATEGHLTISPSGYDGSKSGTHPMLISSTLQGLQGRAEQAIESDGSHQARIDFSPVNLFPPDWRGLTGIDHIWLGSGDWAQLSEEQRQALIEWVARGGSLHAAALPEAQGVLPSELTSGQFVFGKAEIVRLSGAELSDDNLLINKIAQASRTAINDAGARFLKAESGEWRAARSISAVVLPVFLILVLMLVYGVIAGPVNLFLFTDRSSRYRLLLTTPLLATAACLLLTGLILLRDGVGGRGFQQGALFLFPGKSNKALYVQLQASRTGLLISRSFALPQGTLLSEIPFSFERSRFELSEYGYRGGGVLLTSSADGGGGDYFRSRASQAQLIERVVYSRGAVEIARGTGGGVGIRSSFSVPLASICISDPHLGIYYAANVPVGSWTEALPAGSMDQCTSTLDFAEQSNLVTFPRSEGWLPESGFVAITSGSPGDFPINTLSSVKWGMAGMVVVGYELQRAGEEREK